MLVRIFLLGISLSGVLLLSGCEQGYIHTTDGLIPTSLMAGALDYAGVYKGSADGKDLTLLLGVTDRRPLVMTNVDIMGTDCHSRIGRLVGIELFMAQWGNVRLYFEVNPGRCRIANASNPIAVLTLRKGSESIPPVASLSLSYHDRSFNSGYLRMSK